MLLVFAIFGWVLALGLFAVLCLVSSAAVRRNLELEEALQLARTELKAWTGAKGKPHGWFGEHES